MGTTTFRSLSVLVLVLVLVVLGTLGGTAAQAQQITSPQRDERLQAQLERLIENARSEGFRGDVGIYVRHLPSGRTAALQADSLFPTASLIKVPILLTTFAQIEEGTLAYDQPLTFRDSLRYDAPEDLLKWYRDGAEITLSEVVLLMLTVSDNTAALWLQQLLGEEGAKDRYPFRWGRGAVAVNDWLSAHGFEHTRSNSGVPGREAAYERYGWGQTTPREMAEMLVRIRRGEAVSPAASAEMYRALSRSYWDGNALSQLPPTVQAASKQGWVSRSRSEVVLVNAPHGDYVFCVITKDQEDERPYPESAGDRLIRDVSRLLWRHFEPNADWRPPADPYR
jgi:beta-lactamase class A